MIILNNSYRRYAFDLDAINIHAKHEPKEFVYTVEQAFKDDVNDLADNIVEQKNCKIIMLTGPSSSGKTTTAKMLETRFLSHGINPKTISLDDFYLGKAYVPRLPNGECDFESIEALDIPYIKSCVKDILEKGECVLPKYDFSKSERGAEYTRLTAEDNSIIIIEGIHALNPIFTDGLSKTAVKKIYISVKQGVKSNGKILLSASDIRYIRRLVRDTSFRGVTPEEITEMWDNVCDGERRFIRPFKYTSDFTLNTFHPYEPCIIKNDALKRLKDFDKNSRAYAFADKIYRAVQKFEEIDRLLVPSNSLLSEFIGGSIYKY